MGFVSFCLAFVFQHFTSFPFILIVCRKVSWSHLEKGALKESQQGNEKGYFFLLTLLSHTLVEERGALTVLLWSQENAGKTQPSAHHQKTGYLSHLWQYLHRTVIGIIRTVLVTNKSHILVFQKRKFIPIFVLCSRGHTKEKPIRIQKVKWNTFQR